MILNRTTALSFTSSQDDVTSEAVCIILKYFITTLTHAGFDWPWLWFLTSGFAFRSFRSVQWIRRRLLADWKYDLLQAQETANEAGSVIVAESPLSMPESPLTLEQSPTSIRNMLRNCDQPRTGECFEMTITTPGSNSPEVPSSLNTFFPDRSERNQEIHIPVIKTSSCEQQNKVTMRTDEATTVLGAVNDGADLKENLETRKFQALGIFRLKETVTDTIQSVTTSEGYLQPVDNNNLQAGPGKAQLFSPNHPQAKPRVKKSSKRETKKIFQCNTRSPAGC